MGNTIFIVFLFTLLPIIFWFLFHFKRFFIPWQIIAVCFLIGILACLAIYIIEVKIISSFLPAFGNYLFRFGNFSFDQLPLLFFVFLLFIAAPFEEIPKFFILKGVISKSKNINQIVDGIQAGIALGIGFAACENFLHFSDISGLANISDVAMVFVLRFFISTLAHTIYPAVMGYYLALSRFHKLYRKFMLERALFAPILLHGVFNFFLLSGMAYLSVIILAVLSLLLYKWYQDRKIFEIQLRKRKTPIRFPFLAEKRETDIYITKENLPFEIIKKLKPPPAVRSSQAKK